MLNFSLLLLLPAHTMAADPWSVLNDAAKDEPAVAQKRLEALLLEQPSFYPAHFNLGTVLMDSDREGAASHFETATASPSAELAHDAWYDLALVRWRQGRLDDALNAAAKALELDPADAETGKLRDELRRVALYRANEARRKAEAEAKKLRLATSELPEAHVGEAYDARLQAAGGAGGYHFALGSPPPPPTSTPLKAGATPAPAPATPPPAIALPPGLSLDADGRLHGTPVKEGRFPLPLVITDSAQGSVSGNAVLVIQPAPAITTTALPEAILDSPYEATIDAVGLDRPTWTVSGLPPGLTASSEPGPQLRISGTPTRQETARLVLRADDGKRQARRGGDQPGAPPALPLIVSDTFAPDLAVLPPATAWAPYRHQLGVRGRPQAYHWSSPGSGGLQQDAKGLVSGTPEQAGELTLPLTIHAEDKRTRTTSVRVPVNPPPVIEEAQPLSFTVGQPAQRPLTVSGGTPPYTWQIAEGVLPKGLRLDPDGTVRGVASDPGECDVTVALSDRWQAATKHPVHVVVAPKPKDDEQKDQKDQQKQDQKDQQKQDQAKDQKDQQKQDQQKQDQQKQDQQKQDQQKQDQQKQDQAKDQKEQQKQDQAGKDQQDQQQKDQQQKQGQAGKEQPPAGERGAQQAQVLNQAAADRWLESLPKEDRDALMFQLLEGGDLKARRKGKTW